MLPNEKFEFLNLQKYWNKSRLAKTIPSVKGEGLSLSKYYELKNSNRKKNRKNKIYYIELKKPLALQ